MISTPDTDARHSDAIHSCLEELVKQGINHAHQEMPFRCIEIGCGKSLSGTHVILDFLSAAGIKRVNLVLVDPNLDQEAVQPFRTTITTFDHLKIDGYRQTWEDFQTQLIRDEDRFDLAVSIQFSSLLSNADLSNYFKSALSALADSGSLIDICEDDDRLLDRETWGDLTLFQRDKTSRVLSARQQGLNLRRSISVPAHRDTPNDERVMTGLLLSSDFPKYQYNSNR